MSRTLLALAVASGCIGCGSPASQPAAPLSQSTPGGTSEQSDEQAGSNQEPMVPFVPVKTVPTVANFDDANAVVVDQKDLGMGLNLDEKYPTQTIELTGVISAIEGISATKTAISFMGPDFVPLLCCVKEQQAWARLAPGQTVTLHGTKENVPGTLYTFVWKVTQAGPNPCSILDVEKWTAEFEANPEATHQKYNKKWFYLTGKIATTTLLEDNNRMLTMKGSSGWTIELPINHTYFEIADTLKSGQATTLLCQYESYDFQPESRKLNMLGRPITVEFPIAGVTYGASPADPAKE